MELKVNRRITGKCGGTLRRSRRFEPPGSAMRGRRRGCCCRPLTPSSSMSAVVLNKAIRGHQSWTTNTTVLPLHVCTLRPAGPRLGRVRRECLDASWKPRRHEKAASSPGAIVQWRMKGARGSVCSDWGKEFMAPTVDNINIWTAMIAIKGDFSTSRSPSSRSPARPVGHHVENNGDQNSVAICDRTGQ